MAFKNFLHVFLLGASVPLVRSFKLSFENINQQSDLFEEGVIVNPSDRAVYECQPIPGTAIDSIDVHYIISNTLPIYGEPPMPVGFYASEEECRGAEPSYIINFDPTPNQISSYPLHLNLFRAMLQANAEGTSATRPSLKYWKVVESSSPEGISLFNAATPVGHVLVFFPGSNTVPTNTDVRNIEPSQDNNNPDGFDDIPYIDFERRGSNDGEDASPPLHASPEDIGRSSGGLFSPVELDGMEFYVNNRNGIVMFHDPNGSGRTVSLNRATGTTTEFDPSTGDVVMRFTDGQEITAGLSQVLATESYASTLDQPTRQEFLNALTQFKENVRPRMPNFNEVAEEQEEDMAPEQPSRINRAFGSVRGLGSKMKGGILKGANKAVDLIRQCKRRRRGDPACAGIQIPRIGEGYPDSELQEDLENPRTEILDPDSEERKEQEPVSDSEEEQGNISDNGEKEEGNTVDEATGNTVIDLGMAPPDINSPRNNRAGGAMNYNFGSRSGYPRVNPTGPQGGDMRELNKFQTGNIDYGNEKSWDALD